MISRYNNISLALGGPGIILQIAGNVLVRSPGKEIIGIGVAVLGTALLIAGLAFYAMAKGRNPAWCLMGLLSLIGLIVLASLSDLETTKRRKKKKKPPRRYEDDDEDERPRGRRRRVEDDDDDYDEPPRRRRRADEDDEYDDDEQPRRRSRADDDEEEDRPIRRSSRQREVEDEPATRSEQVRQKPPAGGGGTMLVTCAKCQKSLRIPDTLAGKKVKCPACQGVFLAQ